MRLIQHAPAVDACTQPLASISIENMHGEARSELGEWHCCQRPCAKYSGSVLTRTRALGRTASYRQGQCRWRATVVMRRTRAVLFVLAWLTAYAVTSSIFSSGASAAQARSELDAPKSPKSGGRSLTPTASIAVRYFDPYNAVISPDGSKFFIRSYKGDLECDCTAVELTLFAADSVNEALISGAKAAPQPLHRIIRRPTSHDGRELFNARWEPDGKSIVFEGTNKRGYRQLFSLDARSGAVRPMGDWPYGVHDTRRRGSIIIGDARVPLDRPVKPIYPVHKINSDQITDLLFSDRRDTRNGSFVSYRGRKAWEMKATEYVFPYLPSFSPDGHRAISVRAPKAVPEKWLTYYDGLTNWDDENRDDKAKITQFVLIDAAREREAPVFDAPTGLATLAGQNARPEVRPQILWAEDGIHAVLVNAALPLSSESDRSRSGMAYVVAYSIRDARWEIIEPLETGGDRASRRVAQVGWLKEGRELLIRHEVSGNPAPGSLYTLEGDRWRAQEVSPEVKLPKITPEKAPVLPKGLRIELKQSMNDPPVFIATNGQQEIELTSPDPALIGVDLAKQEPFHWNGPDGPTTGGILLPRERNSRPVPFVIQAYAYAPGTFLPDGPATQPYAAQSLVDRGIGVLNLTIPGRDQKKLGKLVELTDFASLLDSVTTALVTERLADAERIGLIGFSRAGFETFYAITHPGKHPLAAAIVDDGFPGTFGYNLQIASRSNSNFNVIYEGDFWSNPKTWLEHNPIFNVHRVVTPSLFTIHNEVALPGTLEIIGAFSMNQIPFEFWEFPEGAHALDAPRERVASQTLSIDWMSFWLQGYEDPAIEKSKQYKRWRMLKELHARKTATVK